MSVPELKNHCPSALFEFNLLIYVYLQCKCVIIFHYVVFDHRSTSSVDLHSRCLVVLVCGTSSQVHVVRMK